MRISARMRIKRQNASRSEEARQGLHLYELLTNTNSELDRL